MKKFLVAIIFLPTLVFAQSWLHLSWSVDEIKPKWFSSYKILPANYSTLNLNFDWEIFDGGQILTPKNSQIYVSLEPKFLDYVFPSYSQRSKIKIMLPFNFESFKIVAKIPTSYGFYEKSWNFNLAKPKVFIFQDTDPPKVIELKNGKFKIVPFYFHTKSLNVSWEKDVRVLSSDLSFSGDLSGVKLKVINPEFPLESFEKNF